MDSWTAAHTYLEYAHMWGVLKILFIIVCFVGSGITLLYLSAVALGAYIESRQERATRRRRNYRVGSVINR